MVTKLEMILDLCILVHFHDCVLIPIMLGPVYYNSSEMSSLLCFGTDQEGNLLNSRLQRVMKIVIRVSVIICLNYAVQRKTNVATAKYDYFITIYGDKTRVVSRDLKIKDRYSPP